MGLNAKEKPAKGGNGQLTREDWIEAARAVLIASGVDDIKVERLAKQMQVTRGSFYWHFEDRKDLLDALLDRWEKQNRSEIAQVKARSGASGADLLEAARIWLGEEPDYPVFDMSVRFWARKDRAVAALVHQIDDDWITLLQSSLDAKGFNTLESLARARIIYFHQIGYNALAIQESLEDRLRLMPFYHKVLVGEVAAAELEKLVKQVRNTVAKSPRA